MLSSNGRAVRRGYRDHLTILRLADFDSWDALMTSRKVRGRPASVHQALELTSANVKVE